MRASGLTNTKREKEAVMVRNVAKLPAVMRRGDYATTADDHGAIGAWIDDGGIYRCEAMRHMHTVDAQTFKTFREVKDWYRTWMKKIGERQ